MTYAASVSTTIQCQFGKPYEFEWRLDTLGSFCNLVVSLRANSTDLISNINIFLPLSMAPQLARAVDAFNEVMGEEPAT
jgi:hypothetical protein